MFFFVIDVMWYYNFVTFSMANIISKKFFINISSGFDIILWYNFMTDSLLGNKYYKIHKYYHSIENIFIWWFDKIIPKLYSCSVFGSATHIQMALKSIK